MNYMRCKNNHFFDIESYQVCPTCGEAPLMQKKTAEPKKTAEIKKTGNFFDKMKGKVTGSGKNKIDIPGEGQWSDDNVGAKGSSEDYADGASNGERYIHESPAYPVNNDETVSLNFEDIVGLGDRSNAQITDGYPTDHKDSAASETEDTLMDEVRRVSSTKDGKTMGIFEIMAEERKHAGQQSEPKLVAATEQPELQIRTVKKEAAESGKTVSFFASAGSTVPAASGQSAVSAKAPEPQAFHEPVVGWLVAVAGPHIGIGFPLKAGKNTIGRETDNDLVLGLDRAVSRVRHATLIYEPRQRVFYMQPGDASGLCYVNGDYCMETVKVKAGDFLEFGDTKLYFVPLCGENFAWEDYLKKE